MNVSEVRLNENAVRDLVTIYRTTPVIKVARNAIMSMVLCGPFAFSIPKLGIVQTNDMDTIIQHFWMPWLRKVFDWYKMFGICPYYLERPNSKSSHQVPVIPDVEMGYITVSVDKRHRKRFRWYWDHGTTASEEKRMLWIVGDDSPTIDGTIQSPMASLVIAYRSLMILRGSQDDAAVQSAHPPHVFEYHPPKSASGNDDLVHMNAQFGPKAAGVARVRQNEMESREMRIRRSELFQQLKDTFRKNRGMDPAAKKGRMLWSETSEDVMIRHNPGLFERGVPLPADYKYTSVTKPTLVADVEKAATAFNMMAAAVMNFPLEMILPTGHARAQNIQGSLRFVNEGIKEWLAFFTSVAQTALVIAYKAEFDTIMSEAKRQYVNRRGGDPWDVAQLYPEIDVKVIMQCTPIMSYQELSQMHMDGIMKKEDFAAHAFHMRALPKSEISITMWPDMVSKELLIKGATTKTTTAEKKKKKEPQERPEKRKALQDAEDPPSKKIKKNKKTSSTVVDNMKDPLIRTTEVRTVN